jgi:hypothetical protein
MRSVFRLVMYKSIVGTISLATLLGCGNDQQTLPTTTIYCEPVSFGFHTTTSQVHAAVAGVFLYEGNHLYVFSPVKNDNDALKADVVVKSEINDGDRQEAMLTGIFVDKYFRVTHIEANGLEVRLDNE